MSAQSDSGNGRAEVVARRLFECGLLDTGSTAHFTAILDSLKEGKIVFVMNNWNEKFRQRVGALKLKHKLSEMFTPDQITEVEFSE